MYESGEEYATTTWEWQCVKCGENSVLRREKAVADRLAH